MSVRQYIGARYVPTYYQNSLDPTSSEWEPNVNYDPLTIVSLPNLHSYQSKNLYLILLGLLLLILSIGTIRDTLMLIIRRFRIRLMI